MWRYGYVAVWPYGYVAKFISFKNVKSFNRLKFEKFQYIQHRFVDFEFFRTFNFSKFQAFKVFKSQQTRNRNTNFMICTYIYSTQTLTIG